MERKLAYRGERSEPSGKVEVIIQPPLLNPAVASYFRPASPRSTDGVWSTLPEIPTSEEIRSSGREPGAQLLQPNIRYGAYNDKEAYLARQYAFLREEAVRPLREAILNIKNIPAAEEDTFSKGSIGIYEKVKVVSWLASTRGIAIRVTFSTRRVGQKIQWQQAKRLMTGSLVALTPSNDMFQSKIVVATIAARPLDGLEQNPPELDLFFARTAELHIDPTVTWVMVEARSSFFEAERHTMLAVQKLASEPFPLSRHIVSVDANITPPESVLSSPQKNLTAVYGGDTKYHQVNVLTSWPTSTTIDLDKSQQQAVQRMFTKALSIIQGPPGTGKTFVSVKTVRALLDNTAYDAAPIIVTAQTNHALDQILRHIAEFEPSFARLGGRSQDKDVVLARTLYNLRQSMQGDRRLPGSCASRAKKEMARLEMLMKDLLEPLAISKDALNTRALLKHDILTAKQVKALEDGAAKWHQAGMDTSASPRVFKLWAKGSMIEVAYKPQHEDFGFTYEEEELEFDDLQDIEAENAIKDDDFVDSLKGNRYSLADNFTCRAVPGSKEAAVKKLLDKTDDLWTLPEGQRGPIYRYLQNQLKQVLARKLRELVERYNTASREFRIGHFERDEVILRAQRVVGCTVTGLSKYRGLLAALSPKIVLIEEAAEVLEAPVLAACFPTLDQLILVGDHQQLRPHCRVQDHQDEPLQYNISLFERLLDNGLDITTLTKQRRMIPEVRRLLRPIYGDLIVDHAYVKDKRNRPDIEGIKIKSFFFHHEYPEGRDELSSCFNEGEAALIVGLANHLVLNGMDSQHITMLTFYNGQRKKLLKLMRQYSSLKGRACPVETVDSYQGEENKVVLLSCVRSNTIGFLSNINRICVALSRAQQGFYIFGNVELLHKNKTWKRLFKVISGRDTANPDEIPGPENHPRRLLYEGFPVTCGNHNNEVWIKEPTDWTDLSGGCRAPCEYVHDCGHVCMLNCHPCDHDLAGCSVACEKMLGCGHVCSMVCGQACVCLTCAKPERTIARLRDARGSSFSSEESAGWHEYAKQEHARSTAGQQTPPGARSSPAKKTGSPLKEQLLIEI